MQTSQAQKQRQSFGNVPAFAVFYLFSDIYAVAPSFGPDTKYSAQRTQNSIPVGKFALKQFMKTLTKLHFRLSASENSNLWS
jgi:hypothetical protein